MSDGTGDWRARLIAAVKATGRSLRSVSLEAGLSEGYLYGILYDGKEPTMPSLLAIAKVLGISVGEIADGLPVTVETQEMLDLWENLNKQARDNLLALAKQLAKR